MHKGTFCPLNLCSALKLENLFNITEATHPQRGSLLAQRSRTEWVINARNSAVLSNPAQPAAAHVKGWGGRELHIPLPGSGGGKEPLSQPGGGQGENSKPPPTHPLWKQLCNEKEDRNMKAKGKNELFGKMKVKKGKLSETKRALCFLQLWCRDQSTAKPKPMVEQTGEVCQAAAFLHGKRRRRRRKGFCCPMERLEAIRHTVLTQSRCFIHSY